MHQGSILIATLLAAAGCGGPGCARDDDAGGPDPPADGTSEAVPDVAPDVPTTLTVSEFCTRYHTLQCDYYEACCTLAEQDLLGFGCGSSLLANISRCLDTATVSIGAGRMTFDGGRAAGCVAALEAMVRSCPDLVVHYQLFTDTYLESCLGMWIGLVGTGGSCTGDLECASGFCDVPDGSTDGSCEAFRSAGEACDVAAACGPGMTCAAGRCAAPCGEGEACDEGEDVRLDDCDAGLWCDGGSCAPLGRAGDACTADHSCEGRCDATLGACVHMCDGPD
jgi:hypothetical protein